MSRRRRKTHLSPLEAKLGHLTKARELATGAIADEDLDDVLRVLESAVARRSLSAEHTVVGFFGATGSGKSALFNAVTGTELARTAAIRPTTSEPKAAIWGEAGVADLLDWLQVDERHVMDAETEVSFSRDQDLETGLVLLDLPDFDSIKAEHRQIVERMAGQVDVLVWVLDPQKYADAALHHDFLIPLATHDGVTIVVLNQIDRLAVSQQPQVVDSLTSILNSEGISPQHLVTTSAVTGEGVPELRKILARIVAGKMASSQRLLADVHRSAEHLDELAGGKQRLTVKSRDVEDLVKDLGEAAHVDVIADAAAGSYRHEATKRTGWAFTRWLGRLRVDPLQRLHLKTASPKSSTAEHKPEVHRSSLPGRNAASEAKADSAIRSFVGSVSEGAPDLWIKVIRERVASESENLEEDLDQAIVRTDLGGNKKSWWWYLFNTIQWVAMLATIVGLGWLLAYPVAGFFQLPLPEAPVVEGWPLPTLLVAFGLVLGIFLAMTARLFVAAGARQRRRAVRKRLLRGIKEVVERQIVEPTKSEIDRYHAFNDEVAAARLQR
ncbi:GTPase [Micrococcoides hystricis]|uniref:GTPase n=1 Tax=Micrococcoides hystricis TaxID=1572761 RepID=A0ABV6PC08_9MICC